MQNINVNGNSLNQLPVFKGVNYHFWSLKMKTLFKSQELWSSVESGFEDDGTEEPDQALKEKRKKDAKALFIIQQALDDEVFPRIAAASTAKEAWGILKQEYVGDKKVINVRLQSLRREFETFQMKEKETVQEYLSRMSSTVQQMRTLGEKIKNSQVVSKVLRSLTKKYDHVVTAIEESKDMETYTFDELKGSLQAHEERTCKGDDKKEEKAFQAKGESSNKERAQQSSGRGRGRGGSRGRGCGRRQSNEGRDQSSQNYKGSFKCYYCKKPGHKEASCWKKEEDEKKGGDQKSNFVEQEEKLFLAQHGSNNDAEGGVWYVDSGCSNHMSSAKSMFRELDESAKSKVRLGDGKQLEVEGKGTIAITTEQGNTKLLYDVQYVPKLAHNLLSIGQLLNSGYSVLFENGACLIQDRNSKETVAKIAMGKNKMFPLDLSRHVNRVLIVKGDEDAKLWHLRYGHLHTQGLKLLQSKEMVLGLPKTGEIELCEGCIYGKQSRGSFPSGKAWRASECLELLHADLCGPMKTVSLGASKYFLLITDDFSRMSWVYFLKAKSEAFESFKIFKAMVEKQSGLYVKALRTDRGGEFLSNEFITFCEEHGIRRELTAPYTPEQNGVAERKNRTVVEMARSMLKARGVPNRFWCEAVATAVYILNVSPTKAVMNMTPLEAWRGKKPYVSHLRIFGCIAYALVDLRTKLDDKSAKCVFIGYAAQSKAYRLYNPLTGKIIVSRNVVFDEEAGWSWERREVNNNVQQTIGFDGSEEESNEQVNAHTPSTPSTPSSQNSWSSSSPSPSSSLSSSSSNSGPRRYRSLTDVYEACDFALLVTDPTKFEEAEKEVEWKSAMNEEIRSIEKNETWRLVNLPEGKNVIGLKWVFRTKFNTDGSIQKHKARLVAKGYAQQEGIDFEETFSPVARFETVRLVLALAAQWKLKVFQLDVKSAFLNGDLQEEVFVEQPLGFVKTGEEGKVYKLQKALYGLKQAPRAWYSKIDSFFLQNEFERSENEPTLYVKKGTNGFIVVCLYVDDIIYFSSSHKMLEEFKAAMMNQFEMSDLGLLQYFLGLEVKQGEDGIFLCQRKYAEDLLKKFHVKKCEAIRTPMNTNEKLQRDDGTEKADEKLFRSLVGGLNYLTHTRPDIAHSVSVVSRYMHSPTKQHLGAARRILKYVAGSIKLGMLYESVDNFKLIGYSDSDWAGCLDDRKSTSGSVFSLGSGAITWSSKKQDTVALSSSEAEYVAAGAAARQAIWLRKLLKDLCCEQEGAIELWCDNRSAIAMTKNPAFHARTKHIEVYHHFIRKLVAEEKLMLKFCGTNEQNADVFTKALAQVKHQFFLEKIGMHELELRGGVAI